MTRVVRLNNEFIYNIAHRTEKRCELNVKYLPLLMDNILNPFGNVAVTVLASRYVARPH